MVTNADPSTTTTVTRRIGPALREFPAPTCILEYNEHMQGVDRLDQIRARFSLADGHSYKRWHKKLALALIDIARTNAYLTRRMAIDTSRDRDPHRTFVTELVSEFISGRWKEAPSDGRMAFGSSVTSEPEVTTAATPPSSGYVAASVHRSQTQCDVWFVATNTGTRRKLPIIASLIQRPFAGLHMATQTLHSPVPRALGRAGINITASISQTDSSATLGTSAGLQRWPRSRHSIKSTTALQHSRPLELEHARKAHQTSKAR
jgi:hypothetical protein